MIKKKAAYFESPHDGDTKEILLRILSSSPLVKAVNITPCAVSLQFMRDVKREMLLWEVELFSDEELKQFALEGIDINISRACTKHPIGHQYAGGPNCVWCGEERPRPTVSGGNKE